MGETQLQGASGAMIPGTSEFTRAFWAALEAGSWEPLNTPSRGGYRCSDCGFQAWTMSDVIGHRHQEGA